MVTLKVRKAEIRPGCRSNGVFHMPLPLIINSSASFLPLHQSTSIILIYAQFRPEGTTPGYCNFSAERIFVLLWYTQAGLVANLPEWIYHQHFFDADIRQHFLGMPIHPTSAGENTDPILASFFFISSIFTVLQLKEP